MLATNRLPPDRNLVSKVVLYDRTHGLALILAEMFEFYVESLINPTVDF